MALDRPVQQTESIRTGDGREIHIEVSSSPMVDPESNVILGIVAVLRRTMRPGRPR
jgi:hypothetical protein